MLDLTLRLDRSLGERMEVAAYEADFAVHREQTHGRDGWKFERRQYFEEDDTSREALARGEWSEAVRLLENDRPELLAAAAADRRRGHYFRRLRVVEEPLNPYMQWELHALRMQAECGRKVRVVDAGSVRAMERDGVLPEVIVLGDRVLYEIVYSETGVLLGAIRFTDAEVIRHWAHFIEDLYGSGEDAISYFDRRVAPLPAPQISGR